MSGAPVRDVSLAGGLSPAAQPSGSVAGSVGGSAPVPATALDALDRRILAELQRDAAQSNLALAARVHASAPTCLRRVRRLVQAGVIERQVALLAPGALGAVLTALCEVTLDAQNAERLAAFQTLACREPTVTQCYQVSPGPDFLLVMLLPDMPAYHALAQRLFTASAHVRNVRTFFAVNRAKFETQVPFA